MSSLQNSFDQLLADTKKKNPFWGKSKKPDETTLSSDTANIILSEAITSRASDIHIEPRLNHIHVRYRIDGKLHDVLKVPEENNINIIPRLKILSDLPTDVGSSRKALDGRFSMEINNQGYDFRVSTFPTLLGDKMVIRILNKNSEVIDLKKIGLRPKAYETMENIFLRKRGLIVVSGPTGAGKTTTLYSILHRLHTPDVNIVTLENPVEYQIDGINQCDVNKKNSESFSTALKATLRQDPDIILIGEIRDQESAEIAIRSSITGHLVMTSLHANSALGSVARLINMGVERHLVSYALTGAVSQHLIPRICESCRTPYKIDRGQFNKICTQFGVDLNSLLNDNKKPQEGNLYNLAVTDDASSDLTLYKGAGCEKCKSTGYHGRIGIFEVVQFTEDIREAITNNASIMEMENIAAKRGFQSLAWDSLQKVIDGIVYFDDIYPILLDKT